MLIRHFLHSVALVYRHLLLQCINFSNQSRVRLPSTLICLLSDVDTGHLVLHTSHLFVNSLVFLAYRFEMLCCLSCKPKVVVISLLELFFKLLIAVPAFSFECLYCGFLTCQDVIEALQLFFVICYNFLESSGPSLSFFHLLAQSIDFFLLVEDRDHNVFDLKCLTFYLLLQLLQSLVL